MLSTITITGVNLGDFEKEKNGTHDRFFSTYRQALWHTKSMSMGMITYLGMPICTARRLGDDVCTMPEILYPIDFELGQG